MVIITKASNLIALNNAIKPRKVLAGIFKTRNNMAAAVVWWCIFLLFPDVVPVSTFKFPWFKH